MFKKSRIVFISALLTISVNIFSQTVSVNGNGPTIIPTAAPFLTVDPESRAGGIGDAGVATSPDVNSMHWNPAKYAFIKSDAGIAVSYSPWLTNLHINDINLGYLAAYDRVAKDQVIGASLRYFSYGSITFTDINGNVIKTAIPNEFAIDATYSRIFSDNVSGAVAFRYINSNLASGTLVDNVTVNVGQSFAADIAAYYNNDIKLGDKKGKLSFGADISNIGTKMSYTSSQTIKDFLPTNLRLGGAITTDLDEYNSVTFTADANKLLVPTPPITNASGDSILKGRSSNVSVVTGMIQSFYDAPGGFKEELEEINYSIGLEYWYRKQFALRTGYFHESQEMGNQQYFTFGVGLKLNVIGFDFSYLVANQNNPLANTMRFTISFDFDAFRKLRNS